MTIGVILLCGLAAANICLLIACELLLRRVREQNADTREMLAEIEELTAAHLPNSPETGA